MFGYRLRGIDYAGVKICPFLLACSVAVNTGWRYRTARNIIVLQSTVYISKVKSKVNLNICKVPLNTKCIF